ncbi:MAG: SDR family NAD(P)-dependent oxidoreductase [Acidothermaceae bacterium]
MIPPSVERVAIVTGGSGSIGGAIVRDLARDGVAVVIGYHGNEAGALATADRIVADGGTAVAVAVDVTQRSSVQLLVDTCMSRYGRLDILVNNAGVMLRSDFLDTSESDWDMTLCTNLKGYFLCGQAAARLMVRQRSGVIVNVSSTNDTIATRGCTAYAVAKGGVRLLTRQMALELAPDGVRVNSVAPGIVESNFNREMLQDPQFVAESLALIPAARFATADDVAAAVVFLASDRATFINGATLRVDGGKTIV